MRVFDVEWRWSISFIDPSCDGSAHITEARSLEEALELGLRIRQAALEVRRILDPIGFEIPVEAVNCYERLKPSYDRHAKRRRSSVVPLRRAAGWERR